MTIDMILRSANPALSLSSQVDDEASMAHRAPAPECLVPGHYPIQDKQTDGANASRSKSAPPTEWCDGSRESAAQITVHKALEKTWVSQSYGKCSDVAYGQRRYRFDGLPPLVNPSSDGSSSTSTQEGDPEEPISDPSHPSGPKNTPKADLQLLSDKRSSWQTVAKTPDVGKFNTSGTSTKAQLQPRSAGEQLPSSLSSSAANSEGGVLVLRPNPVKTVPPISQQGVVAGGVVAPAPRLASNSFVVSVPAPLASAQQPSLHPSSPLPADQASAEKLNQPWCQQASERQRQEIEEERLEKEKQRIEVEKQRQERELQRQERERARQAELRRQQEKQCDFPNSYSNMQTASGRASAEEEENAGSGGEDRDNASPSRAQAESPGQKQQNRTGSGRSASGSAALPSRRANEDERQQSRSVHQSTPVFERLVTDEVRELQNYARMVENQNVEMDKMRNHQKDLEKRLQEESRLHEQLEATLEARERDWLARFEELELEIRRLSGVVKGEENKNKLLLDQIRKKDQDIQGMLKKKYDNDSSSRPVRGVRNTPSQEGRSERPTRVSDARAAAAEIHRSPDDYLRSLGSREKIRERNTRHLLMDFFGM